MTARRVAVALIVVCTVYLVFAAWRGWELVRSGDPVAMVLGIAVLVVPVIVGWLVYREVRFGVATQEMGRALGAQGGLPADDLPRLPSGRVERDAADARFELRRCRGRGRPRRLAGLVPPRRGLRRRAGPPSRAGGHAPRLAPLRPGRDSLALTPPRASLADLGRKTAVAPQIRQ